MSRIRLIKGGGAKKKFASAVQAVKNVWLKDPIMSAKTAADAGEALGSNKNAGKENFHAARDFLRRIWSIAWIEVCRIQTNMVDEESPVKERQVGAAAQLKLLGRKYTLWRLEKKLEAAEADVEKAKEAKRNLNGR